MTATLPGTASPADRPDEPTAAATSTTAVAPRLSHQCEEVGPRFDGPASQRAGGRARPGRLVGLDAARGIALIGMIAVHTISAETDDGGVSLAWLLSSGKSSALFAVLGGVGIAFMTGRTTAPHGADWARAAVTPIVRGLLILGIGLLIGPYVVADDAHVILPYLGLMFLASALLLPLRASTLIGLGLGWAVLSPVLSYMLRIGDPLWSPVNLTVASVAADPVGAAQVLLLTGAFPVLTWMSYLCLGLGIGRCDLTTRKVVTGLVVGGAALAAVAAGVTRLFLQLGALDLAAGDVGGHTTLEDFTSYVLWGGDGTLPADSPWWLTVNAPHTGTPLDLLFTAGIAMLVIGLLLALSLAIGPMLHVLAAPGSMTLTIYTAHVLVLGMLSEMPEVADFALQVIVATVFALLWSSRFRRGPLEWVVWRITSLVAPTRRRAA